MFFVILLYALFASVFTISKTGLQYTQPLFFVGSRMMLAGIVMLAFLYFFRREQFRFKKEHFWRVLKLAAFNIYLTNALEFWGLQFLTSSKTCFIYSLSPFISALFSYVMFDERMNIKKWLGLIVGFVGFMPILLSQSTQEEQAGHFFLFSWAELSVMLAAVSSVYGWILLKQLVKENGYSPMMANGLSMLVGGGLAIIHSVLTENWNPIPVTEGWPFLNVDPAYRDFQFDLLQSLWIFIKAVFTDFYVFCGFYRPLIFWIFWLDIFKRRVDMAISSFCFRCFSGLLIFYQEEMKNIYVETSEPDRSELIEPA